MVVKTCHRCEGYGFVLQSDDPPVYVPCECNIEAFQRYRYELAGIPARLQKHTLENYQPANTSQAEALRRVRQIVDMYPDVERGLCFVGPTGVGKTHLIVALLKELMDKGAQVRFVDCNDLLNRIKRSYDGVSGEKESEIIMQLQKVEILALDDIRTYRNVEWAQEIYFSIVNGRYNLNRLTFFTTNLDYTAYPLYTEEDEKDPLNWSFAREKRAQIPMSIEEQLQAIFTHRIFSRVCEMCDIFHIYGKDRRIRDFIVKKPNTSNYTRDILPPVELPDDEESEE